MSESSSSSPLDFAPFPVAVLPKPVRDFVCNAAEALAVDPSFVALPVLSVLGSAIGNTRRLHIKEGWIEPPIIWTAIVGESGSGKTPALELAVQALKDRELFLLNHYTEMKRRWFAGGAFFLVDGNLPEQTLTQRPVKPDCAKFIADNATIEGLAEVLSNEPRGVLVVRDELARWLRSLHRKDSGNGVSQWQELFCGRSIKIDRKGRDSKPFHLRYATVCLTGGIPLEALNRSLARSQVDSGLAARLLFACPPPRLRRWSDTEVDPQIYHEFVKVVEALSELKTGTGSLANGNKGAAPNNASEPQIVTFSPAAQNRFKRFVNELGDEIARSNDNLFSARSKLQSYAARLALVVHLAKAMTCQEVESMIDEESIEAGITLARWFGREACRIYGTLDKTDHDGDLRKLTDWIARQGGAVTAREALQGNRRFANASEAKSALEKLVKAGVGRWESVSTTSKGGRAFRRFVLFPSTEPSQSVYVTPDAIEENRVP